MTITILGKTYEARADFAAIMDAEEAEGLRLEEFGSKGTTDFLKWLYYFIKRGEELAGRQLEMSRREFCGMIQIKDVEHLADSIQQMMAGGDPAEEVSEGKKKG